MAAMSSIGCFHTLPLSTLISVSEAEERNISPRLMSERAPPAGDKHKWVDTLIGTELPSHGSDPPPPDGLRQIHQDGPHTDTVCMC